MTSASSQRSLRDHLLASLSALPNPERLDLTVLASIPKRTSALFPYAAHPPRCFEKEYLITIASEIQYTPPQTVSTSHSEPGPAAEGEAEVPSNSAGMNGASTIPPDVSVSQSAEASSSASASASASTSAPAAISSPALRRVMVVALHAYLYTIPGSSTSILYISKVDTSGYSPSPLPLTRQLMIAFLGYHLDPSTRPSRNVQVALFARSQSQYLFPNSAQAKGKRVSGGLRLCGWWKGVYEEVAASLHGQITDPSGEGTPSGTSSYSWRSSGNVPTSSSSVYSLAGRTTLRYTLPSYSSAEAAGMLGASRRQLPPGLGWTYAPPFGRNLFEPSSSSTSKSLPDQTTPTTILAWCIPSLPDDPKTRFLDEIVSDAPVASTQRTEEDATRPKTLKEREKQRSEKERKASEAALSRMSTEEYWERMGFRQECSSGDVTGFFHLESVDQDTPTTAHTDAGASTEWKPAADTAAGMASAQVEEDVAGPTKTENGTAGLSCEIKAQIIDRIHQALINTDFKTLDYAVEGSEIWRRSVESLVTGEIGQEGYERCRGVVEAKEGAVRIASGAKEEGESVTMLQPRKRKMDGVNTLQPRRKEPKVAEVNVLQPRRK